MLGDGGNGLWIGTHSGLYHCINDQISKAWPRDLSRDLAVWSLASGKNGDLWMGTSNGIVRLRRGAFESFREKDGLSADVVRNVFVDVRGNVWAGTWGGLDKLSDRFIASYSARQGLSSNQVWSVVEDESGQIWVGTAGGLDKIVGKTAQSVGTSMLPSRAVYSTQAVSDGTLWFATLGGLCRLHGGHLSVYGRRNGLPGPAVNAIVSKRDGTMLVSPRKGGLFTFRNETFLPYLQFTGTVHSISEGRDGSLWLSTSGRLLRVEDRRITATYGGATDDFAFSLEDARGRVWAGSWAHGLVSIRNNRLFRFEHLGRPFNDHIFHIFEDATEHLWLTNAQRSISRKRGKTCRTVWMVRTLAVRAVGVRD